MFNPDKYDKYSDFQREDAREFVPYIISRMGKKPVETVLDFGCGTGSNTKCVLFPALDYTREDEEGYPGYFRLYGIDVSDEMVDYAKKKYPHPNIDYLLVDIMKEDTKLAMEFDKIFSLHVLHWLDQEIALERLYNLLKNEGEIGFYCISNADVFLVYDSMSKKKKWAKYLHDVKNFIPKSYYQLNPAEDMRKMMTSIGYTVHESTQHTRQFHFDTLDELVETAMAANAFIHRIPDKLKDEYMEDFRKCFHPLLRPCKTSSIAVEVDYKILLVRAQKRAKNIIH